MGGEKPPTRKVSIIHYLLICFNCVPHPPPTKCPLTRHFHQAKQETAFDLGASQKRIPSSGFSTIGEKHIPFYEDIYPIPSMGRTVYLPT